MTQQPRPSRLAPLLALLGILSLASGSMLLEHQSLLQSAAELANHQHQPQHDHSNPVSPANDDCATWHLLTASTGNLLDLAITTLSPAQQTGFVGSITARIPASICIPIRAGRAPPVTS